MSTIAESISRIRNGIKAVREDAFITDRFIYSLIMKYGKTLMERDNRVKNLFNTDSLFKEIPFLELTDVPIVDECYNAIGGDCLIKRSVEKLPNISTIKGGQLIRYVSSLDHSVELKKTTPEKYGRMRRLSSFKYNKTKYYWINGGYLFVPDCDYEAVCISASFDGDISSFLCSSIENDSICAKKQDDELIIPEYLLSEVEQNVRSELIPMIQIPVDTSNDKQNVIR
jgi:hypothetical protein